MTRKIWTPQEIEALRRDYPNTPTRILSERYSAPICSIYGKAKALGLKKTPEFLAGPDGGRLQPGHDKGRTTQFKPQHIPANKGQKYTEPRGCEATQFKPGRRPQTWKPIGTERITRDGYLQRKVRDGKPSYKNWVAVHIIVWEEHNGPVPAGHAVIFKDGNKRNVEINNLELISRRQLMQKNTIHQIPEELRDIVLLNGRLKRQISQRTRDEKQN